MWYPHMNWNSNKIERLKTPKGNMIVHPPEQSNEAQGNVNCSKLENSFCFAYSSTILSYTISKLWRVIVTPLTKIQILEWVD